MGVESYTDKNVVSLGNALDDVLDTGVKNGCKSEF